MAKKSRSRITKSRRAARRSVSVRLTVRFKFGDGENETVTVIDNREISMVGSVLDYRDRILRSFAALLLKAATAQPGFVNELIPLRGLLGTQKGNQP
jgi:hypothetical protein